MLGGWALPPPNAFVTARPVPCAWTLSAVERLPGFFLLIVRLIRSAAFAMNTKLTLAHSWVYAVLLDPRVKKWENGGGYLRPTYRIGSLKYPFSLKPP